MTISVGLANVAGYCRVRDYPGCATKEEREVGRRLGLTRPATPEECFESLLASMKLARRYGNRRVSGK